MGAGLGGRQGAAARAELLLVNVFRPPVAPPSADTGYGATRDPNADRVRRGNALIGTAIEQAVGRIPDEVIMNRETISGRAAAELASLARGGDLLVLGSRRRGRLRRIAPGSVARADRRPLCRAVPEKTRVWSPI